MFRIKAFVAMIPLLCGAACGPAFDPEPRPAAVAHLDIMHKQNYIRAAKATLKTFRSAARDLRSRHHPISLWELADSFAEYVHLRVSPIFADQEAENNLSTRLEVAKLQLLCCQVYLELAETRKARDLLAEMQRQFGDNAEFIRTPLDRSDIGVLSIEQGLQELEMRIANAGGAASSAARSDSFAEPRKDAPWNRMYSMPYPNRSSPP